MTKRWIVARYHEDVPDNVEQVGIFKTKDEAARCAATCAGWHSRHGEVVVIFEAEIVETVQ